MHPEKNYELAIKAASLIGFPLVICGSTGRKEPHVLAMKYVEELKAIGRGAARFVLDVRDDEYVKLLQGCSVYLNPGKKESFGLAPLEAMACGKPVVALDAGGTREVVEGGGILVGGDPKDWGREVDRLMKSRSLRNKIGKAAWEHSKQFTWEKTAKELVGAIRPFVGAKT
jgi:glycosyltransferase involved in cell wall biosynthesis